MDRLALPLPIGRLPAPQSVTAMVALEPVYNILMSMVALSGAEDYGGLDEWVERTRHQLDEETLARHDLLFGWLWLDALTNAVERGPATASFPAYLEALAAQDPVLLRDKLFYWLLHSPHLFVGYDYFLRTPPEPAELLADYAAFVRFFEETLRAKAELPNPRPFFELLNAPQELQPLLVGHLQWLWDHVVAAEWQRIQPRLQTIVDAFQHTQLEGIPLLEAMQTVTGRDLRAAFRLETLLTYQQVRFIPQIHNGPYILWFGDAAELRIGFPAHMPASAVVVPSTPLLDQSTAVNRLKALADETRLAILDALRQQERLSTQEIIDRFGLDKSAASRHLRQLVATSLVEPQRDEGAKKVYQINPKAIDEVVKLLLNFL
ncbi:MAG: metalloregulator ArsR/SmtB family transcription factor [Caldilineaceae bacterium]